jgi:hypothetical protein
VQSNELHNEVNKTRITRYVKLLPFQDQPSARSEMKPLAAERAQEETGRENTQITLKMAIHNDVPLRNGENVDAEFTI